MPTESFFITRLEEYCHSSQSTAAPRREQAHTGLFVTDGALTAAVAGDEYRVQTGEMLFVPAGQAFALWLDAPGTGYLWRFHPALLAEGIEPTEMAAEFEFLAAQAQPLTRFGRTTGGGPHKLLDRLLVAYQQEGVGPLGLLRSYLMIILIEAKLAHYPHVPDLKATTQFAVKHW